MQAGMEQVLHKPVDASILKNMMESYNLPSINQPLENEEDISDTQSLFFEEEPAVKNEIFEDTIDLIFYEEYWKR